MVLLQFSCLFWHDVKMTATVSGIIYSQECVAIRKEKMGCKRPIPGMLESKVLRLWRQIPWFEFRLLYFYLYPQHNKISQSEWRPSLPYPQLWLKFLVVCPL